MKIQAARETWTPYLFRNKPQLVNEAPRNLCALPAPFRLEPVVRLAWRVAAKYIRSRHRGAPAERVAGGSVVVWRQSFSPWAAALCADCVVAVLAYAGRRQEGHRQPVQAPICRALRTRADHEERQFRSGGVAGGSGAARVTLWTDGGQGRGNRCI